MTDPFQELTDEHRIIERGLDALEAAAHRDLPATFYERALDLITNFADRCHHGKEEERLFPLLEAHGVVRDGGPIGVMCDEHEIGRAHVERMQHLLQTGDMAGLRRESLEYVALLRQHIQKEDNVLFPIGRKLLGSEETERLCREFAEVEDGLCHEKYGAMADELLIEARSA